MKIPVLRYLTGFACWLFSATGVLAAPLNADDFQRAVDSAYKQFKDVKEGANADYIPILATVPREMFGVVIVTRDGQVYSAG